MQYDDRARLICGAITIALLAGLTIALIVAGDEPLSGGALVHVDINRVDALEEGADVRRSGIVVGRVVGIRQGRRTGEGPARAKVRVDVMLNADRRRLVWSNAVVYMNAESIFGRRYLEVGPPEGAPGPPVRRGHVFRGVDPPSIDRFFYRTYRNLMLIRALAREQGPELQALLGALDRSSKQIDAIMKGRDPGRVYTHLITTLIEGKGLLDAFDSATDDGRALARTRRAIGRLVKRYGPPVDATRARITAVVAKLEGLRGVVGPSQRAGLERMITTFRKAASRVGRAGKQLADLGAQVKRGEGSLGRLMNDRQLDDEIKQTHGLLKESPWRALGRPPRPAAPRGRAPRRPSR